MVGIAEEDDGKFFGEMTEKAEEKNVENKSFASLDFVFALIVDVELEEFRSRVEKAHDASEDVIGLQKYFFCKKNLPFHFHLTQRQGRIEA